MVEGHPDRIAALTSATCWPPGRGWTGDRRGRAVEASYLLAEGRPQEVAAESTDFFSGYGPTLSRSRTNLG
jgi:hypothetical protein